MSEKELLSQLKSLQGIKMESNTKESNKQVLMTQISNTISSNSNVKTLNSFAFLVKNILFMSSRPAMVFAGVFLFLTASLVLGSDLYKNSKPTDSLYIARVISERARLNTTFNQAEREKLAIEFAKSHARDITNALMDPNFNNEENREKVEKLTNSFRSEMAKVRGSVTKPVKPVEEIIEEDKEVIVSVASSLREENSVEVSIDENKFIENSDAVLNSLREEKVATTTTEEKELEEDGIKEIEERIEELHEEVESGKTTEKLTKEKVEEIEQLFESGKYSEVLLLLNNIK